MKNNAVSKKILLKSTFWYISSNFLTKAIAFITVPFFARIMSNEQYGDFTVFASWQTLMVIICGMETYGTINKARFDYSEKEAFDSYISSALMLSMLFTAMLFGAYLIIPEVFFEVFLLDRKYMVMMFMYLFTYPVFSMFQAKQRIEYKYKLSATISFSLGIASSIFAIILTLFVEQDRLLGRIFGQYVLYVIAGICFFIYFLHSNHKIKFMYWKHALKLSVPLVFSALGNHIFVASDNLIIKQLCSAKEVSYIAITISCSNIILLLVQAINSAWAPWLYDMLESDNKQIVKRTFRIYLWAIIAIIAIVVLIGPEIVAVLGGDSYREAIYILPATVISGFFSVLILQFVNLEIYYKKQKYVALFTMLAAVANIVFGIIGVKIWGYRAVCYATVISQVILVGIHYCFTLKINIRELLHLRDLIFALLATLSVIPVGLLIYQNNYIRGGCTAIVAAVSIIVVVFYKKKIISALRALRK